MKKMSVILPSHIALKSTHFNKYLIYITSDRSTQGFVKFNGENVFSHLAKFEVITAETGTGQVHIKCIHNNKFLQPRKVDNGHTVLVADADKQDEDISRPSCTLFKPLLDDGNLNKVRLSHVQQGNYSWALTLGSPYEKCLAVGNDGYSNKLGTYSVIDLDSLLVLPKHVAFKSDEGNYLGTVVDKGCTYLKYEETTVKGQPTTWFEVSSNRDGMSQIVSYDNKMLWSYDSSSNWIVVESTDSSNKQTLFQPMKIEKNVVSLRCLNNKFCLRKNQWLAALHSSVTYDACVEVEELVLSRRIYDTDFLLNEATVYDNTPITLATTQATNDTEKKNTVTLTLSYIDSKSSTWSSSYSLSTGISANATLGIPLIEDSKVVTIGSNMLKGTYEWGSTHSSETKMETTYAVVVPPRHTTIVNLTATKAYCEVPFSYYHRDVLIDGQTVIYKKDDGLYTGVNCHSYKFDTKTIRLS